MHERKRTTLLNFQILVQILPQILYNLPCLSDEKEACEYNTWHREVPGTNGRFGGKRTCGKRAPSQLPLKLLEGFAQSRVINLRLLFSSHLPGAWLSTPVDPLSWEKFIGKRCWHSEDTHSTGACNAPHHVSQRLKPYYHRENTSKDAHSPRSMPARHGKRTDTFGVTKTQASWQVRKCKEAAMRDIQRYLLPIMTKAQAWLSQVKESRCLEHVPASTSPCFSTLGLSNLLVSLLFPLMMIS